MTDAVAEHGRETIRTGSKSFALAARLFDRELHNDVVQLYAWCRYSDDAIDGQELGQGRVVFAADPSTRLAELRMRTDKALAGAPDDHPVFQGLARVVAKHRIAPRHPHELLDGFAMDVKARHYGSEADLLEYCYHVAGVVGVMMANIMGVRDEPTLDRASDLGLAFQLTNIARDLPEDAALGRVYVPAALLRRHGAPTDAAGLADPAAWPQAHRAVLKLLELAETYYRSAALGIAHLPFRCAWAINAALKIYREIGLRLRRQGPSAWTGRVSTGQGRKLWLASTALPLMHSRAAHPRSASLYQRPRR